MSFSPFQEVVHFPRKKSSKSKLYVQKCRLERTRKELGKYIGINYDPHPKKLSKNYWSESDT